MAGERSEVEEFKDESRYLRGGIAEELGRDSDQFSHADKQLIKFHGSYQQEDRDARKNRKRDGLGKHHMFMVRCKIPGGRLSASQYLALDQIAGQWANGTLRLTSRQGVQFHGILKSDLQASIRGINASLLTTLGACGDVNRNVMTCPAPVADGLRPTMQALARSIAEHLTPRSTAYHQIWLDGSACEPEGGDAEPIYGKLYLPRKFKIGIALPDDNCIDVFSQDLGLLAKVEHGAIVGYNLLIGGGSGMTHGKANTFPHLAQLVAFVQPHHVIEAVEAVVRLFRDHGDRTDRKRARIKYLVHDWGVARLRAKLTEYAPHILEDASEIPISGFLTHLGWQPQGDGKFFYGLHIENGRIKDEGPMRLRSALRELIEKWQPALTISAIQDLLLGDLPPEACEEIGETLDKHGVPRSEVISPVRARSMACPAIPTCGLALCEAERSLPDLLSQLENVLAELGLESEELGVRMTGCPNGCVRPYQSDIGIVGRSGDKYTLFVGGRMYGDRLNAQLQDLVPRDQIVATLRPLLERFKAGRRVGESFGDFCDRELKADPKVS